MKKQYIKYLIACLLLPFVVSCEKIIEFDTSISQSELVLNAVPSAEKQLFVNFSYTHFFLDTVNSHPVKDVLMRISVNGYDYYPVTIDRCNYFFDYMVQEDDSLFISVQAGDRMVTAHTTVPRMPRISTPMTFVSDTGTFNLLLINFNIDDHPGHKDYYCVTLHQRDSGCHYIPYLDIYDTIDTVYNTYFFCNDRAFVNPDAVQSMAVNGFVASNQLLAPDDMFDGQNHNTTLTLILLRDTNEVEPYIHQYTLDVETVSPDRYRYLNDISNATSMLQLITEPPEVYSNVNGALGIFAANARRIFPLITLTGGTIHREE